MPSSFERRKIKSLYALFDRGYARHQITRARVGDDWDWVPERQRYRCGKCKGGEREIAYCDRCLNTGNIFGGEEVEKIRKAREERRGRTKANDNNHQQEVVRGNEQQTSDSWLDGEVRRATGRGRYRQRAKRIKVGYNYIEQLYKPE